MYVSRLVIGLAICAASLNHRAIAADAPSADEQAIRAAAKSYRAALAAGDAKAVAEAWTSDGQYTDADGQVHAAKELTEEIEAAGKSDAPEARLPESTIRFLTPEVAIESSAKAGDGAAQGRFQATWVKRDGRWRLANLCEIAPAAVVDPLSDLQWLVGNWRAESSGAVIECDVRWSDEGDYLLRDTTAARDGKVILQSTQRIAWDPRESKVRSWSVDTGGGHVEAVWTRDGKSWVEQASGAMPDGRLTVGTAILTPDGGDAYVRKLVAARVDGQEIPDQELRYVRRAAATE